MAAENEYSLLKKLDCNHIVKAYDQIVTDRTIYTILELVNG